MAQPKRRVLVNLSETTAGWFEWRATTATPGRGSHKGAYMSSLLEADRASWLAQASAEERDAYTSYLRAMGLDSELEQVESPNAHDSEQQ